MLKVKEIMIKWGNIGKNVRFSREKWLKKGEIILVGPIRKTFKKGIDKKKAKGYIKNIEISTQPE